MSFCGWPGDAAPNLAFSGTLPHKFAHLRQLFSGIRMADFAASRRMMVDGQVRTNDVTDLRLIDAMLVVPRERFVPRDLQPLAYLDRDLGVGAGGRALVKPMVLAKMIQAANVGEHDLVLVVGCATGYSSAVLARLADAVVALEEDAELARTANQVLGDVGAPNVAVVTGPLTAGWPGQGPYDVIMLNGAVELVPEALLGQLKDGGRLVGVVGNRPMGKATLYRAASGRVSAQPLFDAAAPLLPGFARPAAFVF
jgi:protein-L-isoaspartate(D-aspartate) O-methyltransferase